ncbi:STM3941 family protein [Paradesertivirga mongoliensis]|uniref:STM3941 family protein n=1 Tax=Paradesertivirga mongoliensis TaxID=2100740 RepID=A0ABW4ZLD6_9SPHI|nr:STM3941 family protein [Pedobacter mongoliensis]
MTKHERIEIPLSKTKLSLLLLGSIAFVVGGIWMVGNPNGFATSYRPTNPIFVFGVGLVSIVFFGGCLVNIAKKLLDSAPGLVIDEKGIYDNSGAISTGLILWDDIRELRTANVFRQKFIIVVVNNPEQYIKAQNRALNKTGLRRNYKRCGSPISISGNGLKINFEELYRLLESELKDRRRQKTTTR